MGKPKLIQSVARKHSLATYLIAISVVTLAIFNFFLIFTPEMGFDALWYHLTLPKLWLLKHQWYFPGGLLYYSVMPRLAETIFIPLVHFTGTIGPKFVQYAAGIGTSVVIWKILSDFKQSNLWKWLGVSMFYCTWLVSWQSGSAYIDLIRTFLEVTALYFLTKKSWKLAGVFLGLAIGTKWMSLGSLFVYALIFGPNIIFPALLVASPWFYLAYHFTGNPIHPIFSGVIDNAFTGLVSAISHVLFIPWYLTKPFDDFISPLAGIIFILALFSLKTTNTLVRKIAWVGILGSLFSIILDPPSSRYFLPYFPLLIIPAVIYISSLNKTIYKNLFIWTVIVSGFFVLSLRLIAMRKYVPFLTGKVDTNTFLSSHLSRLPGIFIDTDSFVSSLPESSKILVDKLHNLYYFPRDFDHSSWIVDSSSYDYLVTIGETPESIKGDLIHTNNIGIQVFKLKK